MERSGPLGADLRRTPADTLWRLERLERGLPASTSIERGRADWAIEEIRRDAGRAERAARARATPAAGPGLLAAGRDEVPDRRGLDDPAPVFGTAKAWIRVEGLLGAAEASLGAGDQDRARSLTGQARASLRAFLAGPGIAARDPQIEAARARLGALAAATGG